MSQQVLQIIKAPDFSDGDSNHRPDAHLRFPIDPEPILKAVALKWIKGSVGHVEPGKSSWAMAVGTLVIFMSSLIGLNAVPRA